MVVCFAISTFGRAIVGLGASAAKNGLAAAGVVGGDFVEGRAATVALLAGNRPFTTLPSLNFHPSGPKPVTLDNKLFEALLKKLFKDRVFNAVTGVPVAYSMP